MWTAEMVEQSCRWVMNATKQLCHKGQSMELKSSFKEIKSDTSNFSNKIVSFIGYFDHDLWQTIGWPLWSLEVIRQKNMTLPKNFDMKYKNIFWPHKWKEKGQIDFSHVATYMMDIHESVLKKDFTYLLNNKTNWVQRDNKNLIKIFLNTFCCVVISCSYFCIYRIFLKYISELFYQNILSFIFSPSVSQLIKIYMNNHKIFFFGLRIKLG